MRYAIQLIDGRFVRQFMLSGLENGVKQGYLQYVEDSAFAESFDSEEEADRKLRWLTAKRGLGAAIVVTLTEQGYWPPDDIA